MRRQTLAASATLAAVGLLCAPALGAGAATVQAAQADAALRYLDANVGADGSVAGALGATEDTVISTADNGFDPATLRSAATGTTAYQFLSAGAGGIDTAGGAGKLVLAWVAAGRPAAFATAATAQLAKLNAPRRAGGYLGANGVFHNAKTSVETANAYSQSFAVLADAVTGTRLPAHATGWLTCAQRADGGFGYAINDSAGAPPSFCGDTASDTNDTAIAVQALARAGVSSADAGAERFLHASQQADGGFGFPGSGSDPDSDATVIQALMAMGQDPTGPAWTVAGHDAMADLESFADPAGSGGYVYPGNSGPDAFTTSAIPQALALAPCGTATSFVAGSSPPPAPTPAPSAPPGAAPPSVPVPATGAGGVAPSGVLATVAGVVLLLAMVAVRRRHPEGL